MIDAAAAQKELIAIAQQIDTGDAVRIDPWAQRLRDLGAAIVGGEYADAWAAIDVHRLIEPAAIVEHYSSRQGHDRWIAQVRWVRNILLFLLFIFIWIGVSLAIQAHAMLVADSHHAESQSQSFIYLWQRGFDGYLGQQKVLGIQLPLWQWFVPIHLVTGIFVVCLLIMLLTGFLIWFKRWSHTKRTLDAEKLRERLTWVLADASLCLATRRWHEPTNLVNRFDMAAHQLLQEMQEERQRLAELANRREKEFADLATFSTGVSGVTNGMLMAANAQKEITASLFHGLQAFSEQYKDIPQQQRTLLLATNHTIHLLQESIDVLKEIESHQEQRMESLPTVLTQLGESIERIVESASTQKSFTGQYVEQQRLFFQNIQAERDLQNKVVQRIINATENTGRVLQEIDKGEKSLGVIAKDMNNMRNQLVAFLNAMKDEIFGELKGAADQITNSGTSLANAATNIEQASQSLIHTASLLKKEATHYPADGANDESITHAITAKLGEYRATDEHSA